MNNENRKNPIDGIDRVNNVVLQDPIQKNEDGAYVYQFQLNPSSFQWSGTPNISMWSEEQQNIVHISEMSEKEQMQCRMKMLMDACESEMDNPFDKELAGWTDDKDN